MPFDVGSRVWVMAADSPWWPAKVLIPETQGVEIPADKDTFIQYYKTEEFDFFQSSDSSVIVAFDTESDKKDDAAVHEAFTIACNDDSAVGGQLDAPASAAVPIVSAPVEQHGLYTPGHKVWVHRRDKSTWWPGKVVITQAIRGADTQVVFYPEEEGFGDNFDSGNSAEILPFETRSEKAATGDATKTAAIEAAQKDANGVEPTFQAPAQTSTALSSKRPRDLDLGAHKKTKKEKGSKNDSKQHNTRSGAENKKSGQDAKAAAAAQQTAPTEKTIPSSELLTLRHKIHEAVDSDDIPRVRKLLLDLVDVRVEFTQLGHTKIGVEVGKLLSNRNLTKLHPLASALINKWAGELPQETKEALVQHLNLREKDGGHGTSAAHSSGLGAAAATQDQSEATGTKSSFIETLIEYLSNPEELKKAGVSEEDARAVAEEIDGALTGPFAKSNRKTIITQLRKPDHDTLRIKLLTKAVSAAELKAYNPEQYRTEKEIQEDEAKMKALMELRDETEKSMYVPTEMFECPKCKENECIFHEQQTRGADEPTTKFVRCLKCGNNWTCE